MKPGHEECSYSTETISTFGGGTMRTIIKCEHEHMEPVQASDVLGNGPTVADYCLCCDTTMRRPEYA